MRSFFGKAVSNPDPRKRSDRGRRAVLEALEGRKLLAASISHHGQLLGAAHVSRQVFAGQTESDAAEIREVAREAEMVVMKERLQNRELIDLFGSTASFQGFIASRVQIRY